MHTQTYACARSAEGALLKHAQMKYITIVTFVQSSPGRPQHVQSPSPSPSSYSYKCTSLLLPTSRPVQSPVC